MACKLCTLPLVYSNLYKMRGACASCKKQYDQLRAGFRGVMQESKDKPSRWDNSEAYEEWAKGLEANDLDHVMIHSKKEYAEQRCDTRDMRREVGLPKFARLESQVYVAWIEEGVKDEKEQLIPTLDPKTARRLIAQKVISSGMIPKVNCCSAAFGMPA